MSGKKQKNGEWITTVQDHISRWVLFRRLSLFNPFPMLNQKNYTFDWHEFKGSLHYYTAFSYSMLINRID